MPDGEGRRSPLATFLLGAAFLAASASAAPLDLEERVAHQRAIEAVQARHRGAADGGAATRPPPRPSPNPPCARGSRRHCARAARSRRSGAGRSPRRSSRPKSTAWPAPAGTRSGWRSCGRTAKIGTTDPVFSSPAAVNGKAYIGATDNFTYAVKMEDGAVAWRAPTPSQVHYSSRAVAGGVVYVGTNESVLWALNAQTGRALWHVPAPVSESSPALANGVLYVGGGDGKLYVFDAATGATLKTLPTNGTIYVSSPVVVNGRVYVGSSDFTGPISGRLYAFGLPAD